VKSVVWFVAGLVVGTTGGILYATGPLLLLLWVFGALP